MYILPQTFVLCTLFIGHFVRQRPKQKALVCAQMQELLFTKVLNRSRVTLGTYTRRINNQCSQKVCYKSCNFGWIVKAGVLCPFKNVYKSFESSTVIANKVVKWSGLKPQLYYFYSNFWIQQYQKIGWSWSPIPTVTPCISLFY